MMSLSWAPISTPTRNNRDRRALSAVTAAKIWKGHDHEDGRYGELRVYKRRFFFFVLIEMFKDMCWA